MNTSRSSSGLRVLIAGGGIAGPALAFWLARGGHHVVVAERFPALRASGAQVDLRGQGIEAIKRMGLLETVREHLVHEAGVALVDGAGRKWATILANTSGQGRQSLTSEYEIMRGDLVRILYDATKDDVEYRFGISVDRFDQDAERVTAHFSDGSSEDFDLLVGADGQGSRIRAAILPDGAADPYRRLGLHMAYWFVPRIASDGAVREVYSAPGGRNIMRRSHTPTDSQAYFELRETSAQASAVHREPVERQQQFWAQRFGDAGWQTERFVDAMASSPDFYSQEVVQVQIGSWSKGRVVLVGDAAHCASPYSGMGISGGLVGAYVLAGELNRHTPDLTRYETTLRPFVDEIQASVKPLLLRVKTPSTRLGIVALRAIAGLAALLRVPALIDRLSHDRGGSWQLPEYGRQDRAADQAPISGAGPVASTAGGLVH
jgi:2-polyprenyl-6-methoxyphenol hydroxylase-like FAD-dependent oxidoreductase